MPISLLFSLFLIYLSFSWVLPGSTTHEQSFIQRSEFPMKKALPVPLLRLSPRPNQYPLSAPCESGVRCSPTCKQCTGGGCSRQDETCCSSSIKATKIFCRLDQGPPCICTQKEITEFPCNDSVCCAQECGSCGGKGCGSRPGGKEKCCAFHIMKANVKCNMSRRTVCVL